jgi:adenine/guanine phosphoribosyltransferase-like PRPP-binding protein
MPNCFIYRVNTGYDGFTPSKMEERIKHGKIIYNWCAYLEALNKGDMVLTHFSGSCRPGVYLISTVAGIDIRKKVKNVEGKVIAMRTDSPLIGKSANPELFGALWNRRRGAELIVPDSLENRVIELIRMSLPYIRLPRSFEKILSSISEIPNIDLKRDLSTGLFFPIIGAFWIRPSQSSWIVNAPEWLSTITASFGKFKGGDTSNVQAFADAMVIQIRKILKTSTQDLSLVCGVPLSEAKKAMGEVDRVEVLARKVAQGLGVPYKRVFLLNGGISRRLYKLSGKNTDDFIKDYSDSLVIKDKKIIEVTANSGRKVLLVDDVLTDGITVSTIMNKCKISEGLDSLNFVVATLGIMTKKRNMAPEVYETWER